MYCMIQIFKERSGFSSGWEVRFIFCLFCQLKLIKNVNVSFNTLFCKNYFYYLQKESVNITAKEKAFVKNMPLPKISDILWAFTGRDLYRMLVIERGWSSDEYEHWLAELLIQTLLKPELKNALA